VNTPSTLAIPRGELRSSELDPFQLTFTRKITRRHCCADSRSRANTNDCLPCAPPGRTEGGDGIVECRDGADVRPQSFVAHALDDLVQLGTIAFDDEVVPAARLHAKRDCTASTSGLIADGGNGDTLLTLISHSTYRS